MKDIRIPHPERDPKLTVKEIGIEDIRSYVIMNKKSWIDAYANYDIGLTGEKIDEILSAEYIESRITELEQSLQKGGLKNMHVLYHGDTLIGIYEAYISQLNDRMYGQIKTMYLDPDYIGQGYGSFMMKRAIKELEELGAQSFYLEVISYNQRAIEFYKRFGFKNPVELVAFNFGGFYLPLVRLFLEKNDK